MTSSTKLKAIEEGRRGVQFELGSRRWSCAWWTKAEWADPDAGPISFYQTVEYSRVFPSQGLAVAFAARIKNYYGAPMVREEVFGELDRHSGLVIGSWEGVGEWEEVVPVEASAVNGEGCSDG